MYNTEGLLGDQCPAVNRFDDGAERRIGLVYKRYVYTSFTPQMWQWRKHTRGVGCVQEST